METMEQIISENEPKFPRGAGKTAGKQLVFSILVILVNNKLTKIQQVFYHK